MGMQCHFSRAALPENTSVGLDHDKESDTWTATIKLPGYVALLVNVLDHCTERECYWFDIGSWSDHQQLMIGILVKNRVCFSCS